MPGAPKESGAERVGAASDHFESRLAPWYQPGHPHVWSVNQESVLKALCNWRGFPQLARFPSKPPKTHPRAGEWQGMRACAQNDSHPPLLHLHRRWSRSLRRGDDLFGEVHKELHPGGQSVPSNRHRRKPVRIGRSQPADRGVHHQVYRGAVGFSPNPMGRGPGRKLLRSTAAASPKSS